MLVTEALLRTISLSLNPEPQCLYLGIYRRIQTGCSWKYTAPGVPRCSFTRPMTLACISPTPCKLFCQKA